MRLIDADALLDEVIERYCKDCDRRKGIKSGKYRVVYNIGDVPCRACSTDDMKDELENAPTIETERKTGKWVLDEKASEDHIEKIYRCSACNNNEAWGKTECTRFCSWCGAQMEIEQESD